LSSGFLDRDTRPAVLTVFIASGEPRERSGPVPGNNLAIIIGE
jgi:hypothetical protein